MSVNAELYKHLHGAAATDKNEDIKALEKYFHTRRENVAQVTVMPNFCVDEDMTYAVRRILKDKADTPRQPRQSQEWNCIQKDLPLS